MAAEGQIEFSAHARRQMAARGISDEEVRIVMREPDVISPGRSTPGMAPSNVLRKRVAGRRLKVIVTDTDPPKVITVAAPDE